MADFEDVRGIRGARLADLPQHVTDVRAVQLAPDDDYEVGKLVLAGYDFVPYALSGLSAAMTTPTTGTRPSAHVVVPIADDKGGTATVERDVVLHGPGDVLGIDLGQVARRYPAPGSTNAEETFHAHIEFDRPELPWAFSAQTPGDSMGAWLALVVLEKVEVEWEPVRGGLQPVMSVAADRLPRLAPPLGEAGPGAWAHAQASAGSASLPARLSTAYAPVNVSRLLASRVLTQDTDYVACLVPTTEAGRLAGLGTPGGGLGPAWTPQDGVVRLPVCDHWEFRTAPDGDFARLARRLEAVAAPWRIGRRLLDTSRPGQPLPDLGQGTGRRQVVRCALFSPNAPDPEQDAGAPSDTAAWSAARTTLLQQAVDAAAAVEGTAGTDPGGIPNLPIVGPRVYARGQRGSGVIGTLPAGDWFAELNGIPVNRVVGGIGTRVVQRDQEPLMQAAWAQVGEIDKANRELVLAQLARHLAASLHARVSTLGLGRLLELTRPLAPRVRLDGAALTLHGQAALSATPVSALGGAFRRATRVAGPLTLRLGAAERRAAVDLVTSGAGARDFTRPYADLDGIRGLSPVALASLDPAVTARALAVPVGQVAARVATASDAVRAQPTLAGVVSTPSLWKDPDTSFRMGQAVAQRVVAGIELRTAATPAGPGRGVDVPRSRWLGGLAAGLATTDVAGTGDMEHVALDLDAAIFPEDARPGTAGGGPVRPGPVVHPLPGGRPGPVVHVPAGGPGVGGLPGTGRGPAPAGGLERPAGGQRFLRDAAAWRTDLAVGLPPTAAGSLAGSINRPLPHGGLGGGPAGRPGGGGPGGRGPVRWVPQPLSEAQRIARLLTTQGQQLAAFVQRADRVSVSDLRAQAQVLVDGPGALALPPTPARPALAVDRADLLARLDPARTVVDATRGRLQAGALVPADWFADTLIRPIMAAPRFDRPMYQALDAYDREWLVPGLTTLRQDELVTVLSSNDVFTEAFLVGLSDEMGRELLWRSYPTDMRGTYFHRFWDPARDELTAEIHRFGRTRLGSHVRMGPPGQSGRAVVLLRGEIVRRYPDLTVMALRATGTRDGHPDLPDAPTGEGDAAPSLFNAFLEPDIMLAGLDITVDELRSPGWWIVVAEHPQAPRFRRSEPDLAGHEVRFATAAAGSTGATVAAARLENPTRVAFAASDFLPPAS